MRRGLLWENKITVKYACKCERRFSYNSAEYSWSIQPQASFTNLDCSELNSSMNSLFKICLKRRWTISQWGLNRKFADISCWQWFTFQLDHQEEIMMTKNVKIRRYHVYMLSPLATSLCWFHLLYLQVTFQLVRNVQFDITEQNTSSLGHSGIIQMAHWCICHTITRRKED